MTRDSENHCGRIEKGTRCGPPGAILAFKTAPEEVSHHCKTRHITILRSYGELGLELPTQVESKIERKSEQNSLHDLLVISALQRLENTEAGHAPEGQSSSSYLDGFKPITGSTVMIDLTRALT